MGEAEEELRVRVPLEVFRALGRFCRYYDLAEADYVAWLVVRAALVGRTGSFPLPSVREAEAMRRAEES